VAWQLNLGTRAEARRRNTTVTVAEARVRQYRKVGTSKVQSSRSEIATSDKQVREVRARERTNREGKPDGRPEYRICRRRRLSMTADGAQPEPDSG